jgi:hypothetical protein
MHHQPGLDAETAARQQVATDKARAAYVRHFYRDMGRWDDPANFHLMLDSTALPLEACTKLIVAAARAHLAASARSASPA